LALRALPLCLDVVLSWPSLTFCALAAGWLSLPPLIFGAARSGFMPGCRAVLAVTDLAVVLSWLSLTFGAARFGCWLAFFAAADFWRCAFWLYAWLSSCLGCH
jgi:hypothetical protein